MGEVEKAFRQQNQHPHSCRCASNDHVINRNSTVSTPPACLSVGDLNLPSEVACPQSEFCFCHRVYIGALRGRDGRTTLELALKHYNYNDKQTANCQRVAPGLPLQETWPKINHVSVGEFCLPSWLFVCPIDSHRLLLQLKCLLLPSAWNSCVVGDTLIVAVLHKLESKWVSIKFQISITANAPIYITTRTSNNLKLVQESNTFTTHVGRHVTMWASTWAWIMSLKLLSEI